MSPISKYLVLILTITILFSCSKDEDPIIDPSASVSGEWNVTTVKTTIQNKGTDAETNELDLSSEAVFFNFKADGTYTTNAKISLSSVSKSSQEYNGNYTFSNNQIKLDYFLEDFNINVNFTFKVNELNNTNLTLILDEGSLLSAFNESIGTLSGANQIVARLLIDNIVDFESEIKLTK